MPCSNFIVFSLMNCIQQLLHVCCMSKKSCPTFIVFFPMNYIHQIIPVYCMPTRSCPNFIVFLPMNNVHQMIHTSYCMSKKLVQISQYSYQWIIFAKYVINLIFIAVQHRDQIHHRCWMGFCTCQFHKSIAYWASQKLAHILWAS